MNFRIAIHERKGSFSDRWVEYCIENEVPFEKVNCFDNNIIAKLERFDALLWHWVYHVPSDVLVAKSLLQTLESMGKIVFPDIATCWHYDNKIGQKYLLETIGAPLVPTYVFYEKDEVLEWINTTSFPKVFKLSTGAGSENVKLVRTRQQAANLCKKAFGKGFLPRAGYFSDIKHKVSKTTTASIILQKMKRAPHTLMNIRRTNKLRGREKGYVYFQEFIPGNLYDIRITVIGDRAFGFLREVRKNDFRASGSGLISYDIKGRIDDKAIKLAFDVAQKLRSQSLAIDFLRDRNGNYFIVEISYCFVSKAIYDCPGHWRRDLSWHVGKMWPEDAIMQDVLEQLSYRD